VSEHLSLEIVKTQPKALVQQVNFNLAHPHPMLRGRCSLPVPYPILDVWFFNKFYKLLAEAPKTITESEVIALDVVGEYQQGDEVEVVSAFGNSPPVFGRVVHRQSYVCRTPAGPVTDYLCRVNVLMKSYAMWRLGKHMLADVADNTASLLMS
jgi:hypothetical protein